MLSTGTFIGHKSSISNSICWFLKIFFFVVLELTIHVFVSQNACNIRIPFSTVLNITSVSTGYQEQILLRNNTAALYYLNMYRIESICF